MRKPKAALSDTLKQEFKKDLELFEYFLVLLNSSSPIRNVELMWAEDLELFDPSQGPRVNTGDALVQLQPVGAGESSRSSPSPSTHFCDLVHGFGAHEEQTCARSDKPAKERCRATGRSQVYPCHVGLTDIAVPVSCEGRYLGTLFSGQVLTQLPSPEGFAIVCSALQGQPHIDLARLEEAYYRVPVVTTAQLAELVRMLEVFARYLANAWKRLEIIGKFQQMHERELALDRRELAEMLLSGQAIARNPEAIRTLARNVGIEKYPDRVMVLRLQAPLDEAPESVQINPDAANLGELGTQLNLMRAAHIIEDRARSWANTLATVVSPGEMCVFTSQRGRTPAQERLLLDEIAQSLLRVARAQGLTAPRIGISGHHPQPSELLRAYHEASSALDSGRSTINWFETLPERQQQQPTLVLGRLLKALRAADSPAITASLREFLAAAAPVAATVAQLQQSRGLLTWAAEHLVREVIDLGAKPDDANLAKDQAVQIILGSQSSYASAEAFRSLVEALRTLVIQLFSQREPKIVSETQRLVGEIGPANITIQRLAKELKLSAGHLGRVFSRTTGHTLEEYLIRERLEMSKRLLLDPRLHVSEVAEQCGFCNPAYFASVFKKYMHCTPRAFARQPQRWGMYESTATNTQALHA